MSFQQIAEPAQSGSLESDANELLEDVCVCDVNVGNADIDFLVLLGPDAERSISIPYLHLPPRAPHPFIGTQKFVLHQGDAIVVKECVAEVQVPPILQRFQHLTQQADAHGSPELVDELAVDVLFL